MPLIWEIWSYFIMKNYSIKVLFINIKKYFFPFREKCLYFNIWVQFKILKCLIASSIWKIHEICIVSHSLDILCDIVWISFNYVICLVKICICTVLHWFIYIQFLEVFICENLMFKTQFKLFNFQESKHILCIKNL